MMHRGSLGHTSRREDECDLEIMHLVEGEGLTLALVAERLGLTRSTVSGRVRRVRLADDVPDQCRKVENQDGGMPERWWANGA